jgi:hypothetical protein
MKNKALQEKLNHILQVKDEWVFEIVMSKGNIHMEFFSE